MLIAASRRDHGSNVVADAQVFRVVEGILHRVFLDVEVGTEVFKLLGGGRLVVFVLLELTYSCKEFTIIVHHMMKAKKFKDLSCCKDHQVSGSQNTRFEVHDHTYWISQMN